MNIYIVIPAHNEEATIGLTLESLVKQSVLPKKVVVVNDHSTDNSQRIIDTYTQQYPWIISVTNTSSDQHLPGAKIIDAFYKGYELLDDAYDIICKYDADLIFPENYLEVIVSHFKEDDTLGMVAGHCYVKEGDTWERESLTSKDHIRGALKAYRKQCFLDIGKLKRAMGWDTIDELLAVYHGWHFKTDDALHVKHLKPTGAQYIKESGLLQGEALYRMRMGLVLSVLSAIKLAFKKRKTRLFFDYMRGYFKAKHEKLPYLITAEQGKFVRQFRWKKISKKLH